MLVCVWYDLVYRFGHHVLWTTVHQDGVTHKFTSNGEHLHFHFLGSKRKRQKPATLLRAAVMYIITWEIRPLPSLDHPLLDIPMLMHCLALTNASST